jgi:hypothetical protein
MVLQLEVLGEAEKTMLSSSSEKRFQRSVTTSLGELGYPPDSSQSSELVSKSGFGSRATNAIFQSVIAPQEGVRRGIAQRSENA